MLTALEPPGADLAKTFFARQLAGEVVYFIAWSGREPVGTGELRLAEPAELCNLSVRPRFRGQGIGTLIIATAEGEIGAGNKLAIGVSSTNSGARRLYERLGYVSDGTLSTITYEYVDEDGVTQSATETDEMMTKQL